MIGHATTKCPLILRIVLSPLLLLWYGARVYLCPCIGISLYRATRCCCRGCLEYLCCGCGLTFTDKSFPATDQSIGKELTDKFRNSGGGVEWKRADVLKAGDDNEPFHLFNKDVEAADVKQGAVGDCWLVAAMSTLAVAMPGAIRKLFVNPDRSWRGKYKVRLFDVSLDKWTTVTVDDIIPTRNGRPLFAKPNGKELWVVLLEKAIAKHCGSYSAIAGGYEAWGLKVLTGNHVFAFRRLAPKRRGVPGQWQRFECLFTPTGQNKLEGKTRTTNEIHESDKFWGVLLTYAQGRKGAMCCSIVGEQMEKHRNDGLIELHAYSITKAVDLHGQKLIQLRNPWGKQGEWKGRWSDESREWRSNSLIRNALGHKSNGNDGVFWMCWEDFREVWTEITICSRSTDASDLAMDVHEELGCIGPCVGCVEGCAAYWCLCRGCRHVVCSVKSQEETRKGKVCRGCVCCV